MIEEKTELKFCRLCGKNKAAREFNPIELGRIGQASIFYDGCDSCAVVVHNSRELLKEIIMKEQEKIRHLNETPKIVIPPVIVPRDFKKEN